MVFYRSQFFKHVVAPFFQYVGIALVCCMLIFGYFLLKNYAAEQQVPIELRAIDFGTAGSLVSKPTVMPKNTTPRIKTEHVVPPKIVPPHPEIHLPNGEPKMEPVPAQPQILQQPNDGIHHLADANNPLAEEVYRKAKQNPIVAEADKNNDRWTKDVKKIVRKGRPDRGEPGSDSFYVIPEQLNTVVKVNKTAYKSRTCTAITGRRVLMNYAHNCCKRSQPLNCESGLKNGFDICIQFSQASIDQWFLDHSKDVFQAATMAGYGVWKAYLIMRLLMTLDDDDVLFYSDSGAIWQAPPDDYFCLMDERQQDAVVFSVGLPEDEYTKGDAFLVGNCLTESCQRSQQRLGGYSMYRKSMFSFNFLSTWLTFNQDLRIVSDQPSTVNKNLPGFKANRHDQTALSLSSKRCGIPEWPDPSQWGEAGWNKMLREKPEFKTIAKTIIDCTRDKS